MINIENQIFTDVLNAVVAVYPDADVTGVYVPSPSSFPAVYITMIDDAAYQPTADSGDLENHAEITFDVDVYSNAAAKKAECYDVMSIVDGVFSQLNFTRTTLYPVPNLADATIYRLKARYSAIVGKNEIIYRR